MKQLLPIFLSAAAISAFASATPVVAQETMTGMPRGTAPITAEPPHTRSHGPGNGYNGGTFAALGAILAAPFDTIRGNSITSNSAETTQPGARCDVTLDCSMNDYRGVP
jgi:hypothetical protein